MVSKFYVEIPKIIAAAFDTETNGLHHIYDKPFLFQFGWCVEDRGVTYAVDIELQNELARRTITLWNMMARQVAIYLGHHITFDLNMLMNINLPYTGDNVSDSQFWIRLGNDAIQTDKGGVSLKLKDFAQKYISRDAKNMNKKLDAERTAISSALNLKLKKRLKWNKKQIDAFFKDKLNTAADLPADKIEAYNEWHSLDLPLYLQSRVKGAVSSDNIAYNTLDRETVIYYGHLDIVWTLEAFLLMQPIVALRGNLEAVKREETNIYPLLAMERVGFKIDFEYLKQSQKFMREYILQRRKDLCQLAGMPVRQSQSVLLIDILNSLGVPVETTNAEELSRINAELIRSGSNPTAVDFIETLQELRTLEKWYSTYIMRFVLNFNEEDGKLYTTIHQTGTVAGRVTSDFQQFPKGAITTLDGREIFNPRKMVLAQDGDFIGIVYLDYSQVELRFQAFYTILIGHPDQNLCRAYMPYKCVLADGTKFDYTNSNHIKHSYSWDWYLEEEPEQKWKPLDVHGATTKIAFGIDETHPDFHARRYEGKTLNFAKNYGAQRGRVRVMFPYYSEEMITKLDEAYYLAFPGVKEYHSYCYKMSRLNAYMQNMFGVRYYGMSGHNLINALVQGSAAYFLKWKIAQVKDWMINNKVKSELMMQIHDELQFKWHKDDDPTIFFKLKEIMEEWDDAYVPIVADMELATTTWSEKYEVKRVEDFYDTSKKAH